MRVTGQMIAQTALRNINANTSRMQTLQDQLTSGKRVSRASDDPVAVTQALIYKTSLNETSQYKTNIDEAIGWLNTTDTALGSTSDLLSRARELAVEGANDTLSGQDRSAIADEVDQLLEQSAQVGNTAYGSRYIFAGTKTGAPPFAVAPGGVTYSGDAGNVTRQIGASAFTTVNAPGSATFGSTFTALRDLSANLRGNNASGIATSITALDAAANTILSARSAAGAKVNALEAAATRASDMEINQTGLLSKAEDLDIAEAITNFSIADTVYKASLQAGSRALQPSLLDYLR
jgi:flagellar hook-associated protein 3 FlgL